MDNKGQVIIYGLMLCVIIIVMALALARPIQETVDSARANSTENSQGMNCTDASISNFDNAACIAADLSIFYFIGGLIFVSGVILTSRILFS